MDNELYHHGVKGMKWGKRRYQNPDGSLTAEGKRRADYKQAKKDFNQAGKEFRKETRKAGFGIKGIERYNNAEKKYNDADMKFVSAKAKYASGKSEKAEFKTYYKEMRKTGLPGSGYDKSTGGRSTRLYNEITRRKGKDYADKVAKKLESRGIAALATSAVVSVGALAAAAILGVRETR